MPLADVELDDLVGFPVPTLVTSTDAVTVPLVVIAG